jgi:hypothetical protein
MLFAFSRDGGLPGSSIFRKVYWGGPTNSIFLAVLLAFILGLPMLNNYTAFAAITSIGVVGIYISYAGALRIPLLSVCASLRLSLLAYGAALPA